jgi:NAD(P)-dependent dehydrogenase (short-subunit alcohol dehydrogenase family)
MNLELEGRHVLVSGGSRGIGLACVRGFLQEGCKVSIVGRDEARLREAARELDAGAALVTRACDLVQAAAAERLVDELESAHGPVDVLVNAAGAPRRTPFDQLRPQDWMDALQSKFLTYVNVTEPLIKRMAARGGGAIVNVIGLGGKVPSPINLPGGAANAALMLATAGWAAAWASRGVRVNGVNPTLTETGMLQDLVNAEARSRGVAPEAVMREKVAGLPLGRPAAPQEVASAVLFLASARASYISGVVVGVDGASRPMIV